MTKQPKIVTLFAFSCATVVLLSFQAFAETTASVMQTQADQTNEPASSWETDVGYNHRIKTDIHKAGGDFDVQSIGAQVSNKLRFNSCYTMDTELNYEYNNYQMHRCYFQWNKVYIASLNALISYQFDERWSFYGGPMVTVGAGDGARIGNSFSGGGAAGFKYMYSSTLTAGAGIAVVSRIKDSVSVLPLFTLDWMFHKKGRLHIGFSDFGSTEGYGIELSWIPFQNVTLATGGLLQNNRFLLATKNASAYSSGVGTDKYLAIYAKASWQFTKFADIEGFAGGALKGSLKLDNKNGSIIGEQDYGATPMFGVRACINF